MNSRIYGLVLLLVSYFVLPTAYAANTKPVALPQTVSIDEDSGATTITLQGTDTEGDSLTYALVSKPLKGTLTLTQNKAVYTPNLNANGTDAFTFTVKDAALVSTAAKVSITIKAVDDTPVASRQTVSVVEDTSKPITLMATDPDSTLLTYKIAQPPVNSTATLSGKVVTYKPNTNFNGEDSFSFTATDGTTTSVPATVSLTVTAVNDAPTASAQSVSTDEDKPVTVTLAGIDPEGKTLTYAIGTRPTKGTLVLAGNVATYTPNANSNGTDSFTFTVKDEALTSTPATVSLTIKAVNDAPTASAQALSFAEDTSKQITLVATDPDSTTLTYAIATPPANGTATISGKIVTYKPNLNFNGTDSFTFTVSDGTATSAPATVSLTITAVNDAPTASAQSVSTDEDKPVTVTLAGIDPEGKTLTYAIGTRPTKGTLVLAGNVATYTPNANSNGTDSFTFTVKDEALTSTPATVSLTIKAVNDAPTASAQALSFAEDTSKQITLVATDPDSTTLTYAIATPPANGTATISGKIVTYKPNANFNGTDSFTFTVSDGTATSTPATVSLTITAVNDAPTASAQSVSTDEDKPVTMTLAGIDPEGKTLTYAIGTRPTKGTLVLAGNVATYTPNANSNGTDSFTFTVKDEALTSTPATVSLTIKAVNDAPTASAQALSFAEDTSKQITLVATDPDSTTLTYAIATPPANGTATISGKIVTYKPNANFNGTDSFTFTVSDGTATSTPATVSLTITAVNDAPTASAQTVSTEKNKPVTITIGGTDPEGSPLTYALGTRPLKGSVVLTGNVVTYTPTTNYMGSDSFTFTVKDGLLTSPAATVSLTVKAVNIPPTATAQSVSLAEDSSKTITLAATDPDNTTLTYALASQPAKGTATISGNVVTYQPNANFNGTDSFTFTASDGAAVSAAATVNLTVTAVNDAPVATAQTITVPSSGPTTITLTGTDVDGDTLTYALASSPVVKATLSAISNGKVTYTPKAGITSDAFAFTVKDASLTSSAATVTITVKDTSVIFTDPNLLACFEGAVPTATALATLQSFSCEGRDLSTANLAQLANLPALKSLSLVNTKLTSVTGLAGLTGLTRLDLSFNEISDITALTGMTQLGYLNLGFNNVGSISALSGLNKLTELYLDGNQITSIAPLASKTTLTKLYLDDNQLTDISLLSGWPNLTHLGLGYNKLTDVTALASLIKLQALVLDGNNLNTITALSGLMSLQNLYLRGNLLTDISALANLTGLQVLELGFNQISVINALTNLKSLTRLGLDYNAITTVSALAGLTQLQALDLEANLVSSVSSLIGLNALQKELRLHNNRLLDVSALANLASSFDLLLEDNCLGSVSLPSRIHSFGEDWQFAATRCAVAGVNNMPVAYSKTALVYRNMPTTITLDAIDPDGDTLTYTLQSVAVSNGSLNKTVGTLTGNTLIFTPVTNYSGSAGSFTFVVKDSKGLQSAVATVQLVVADPPPQITDPVLQNCFGGSSPDEITLQTLATLSCSNINLSAVNWQDLNDLPQLKRIELNGASLTNSDVSELVSNIPNVTEVFLENNQISDLSLLAGFTKLQTLSVQGSQISKLDALTPQNFPNLIRLKMGNNPLTDYRNIGLMTNLIMLILENAQLDDADISWLPALTSLQYLDLRQNQLTQLQALTGLTRLSVLLLDDNDLTDTALLSPLTQLANLWLTNNRLTTIALPSLTALQDLRVGNNCLTSAPIVPATAVVTGITPQRALLNGVCPAL